MRFQKAVRRSQTNRKKPPHTGNCIIEAHALSESLQCAGCAVVPTLESEFSKDGETLEDSFQEDLLYWQAPLKNSSSQKLLMLNFLRHVAAAHTNFPSAADARRDLASIFPFPELTPEKIEEAKELVNKETPGAVAKVEADIAADEQKQFETNKSDAENGNPMDQVFVGLDYAKGLGVPKDEVEAAKWYRRAALQGNSSGECCFGVMCMEGTGVPQDFVEAYKWFNLAAAQDDSSAPGNRAFVARKMTPDQIAEAQRLSTAFVPQKETSSTNSTSQTNH
jgi:uncharacterized protein